MNASINASLGKIYSSIEVQSALMVLRVCYRQSCKDSWKIYNALTSDTAIAYYRFALRLCIVFCGLIYLAGRTAGVLWYQYIKPAIDDHVDQCLIVDENIVRPRDNNRATTAAIAYAGNALAVCKNIIRASDYRHHAVNVTKALITYTGYFYAICMNIWRRRNHFTAMVKKIS